MSKFILSNKVAIVTGSTHGIGREIALELAEEGVKVLGIGRDKKAAEDISSHSYNNEGEISFCMGDVSNVDFCKSAAGIAYAKYGKIDILVNCAGILSSTKIEDITEEEWNRMLSVNLNGSFFMIQSVIPYMKKNGTGRIINISSNAGRMGGYENSQSYTASKGGIIAITMGIARQLAPYRITVNVLCPGTTVTDMSKVYDENTLNRLINRIPMGRLGRPEDTASAVCYFASDEAAFITGAILDINGGMYMG